jgi:phage shock protein PspC (stress-responsive transcriptional regulator)
MADSGNELPSPQGEPTTEAVDADSKPVGGESSDNTGGYQPPPHETPFRNATDQLNQLRRLRRGEGRRIGGVAGGIARHFNVDPLLIRVAFVVLAFVGGTGLLLYLALWVIVPEESTSADAWNSDSARPWLIGFAVLITLVVILDANTLGMDSVGDTLLTLLAGGAIAYLIIRSRNQSEVTMPPPPPTVAAQASGPDPVSAAAAPVSGYGSTGYPRTPPGGAAVGYSSAPQQSGYQPSWSPPLDPRRRGPLLFWATCALIAVALGSLGLLHASGVDITPATYPAVGLAVVAVMLILGAWYGRGGGLILLGLMFTFGLLIVSGIERIDLQNTTVRINQASDLSDRYTQGAGDLTIDLSEVTDIEQLRGQKIEVEVGAGDITVLMPPGVTTRINAEIGYGSLTLYDRKVAGGGGIDQQFTHSSPQQPEGKPAPLVILNIANGYGDVKVESND